MNTPLTLRSLSVVTVSAVAGLTLTSCSTDMGTREKVGIALLSAGTAGMSIKKKEKAEAAAFAATAMVGGVLVAEAIILERRSASSEQRRVAQENARRAYSRMSEKRKAAMRKDGVRYLAVNTVQSGNSRGSRDVMIYDTKTGRMKSNTAFDVRVAPDVGERVKFDTIITEYVGGKR